MDFSGLISSLTGDAVSIAGTSTQTINSQIAANNANAIPAGSGGGLGLLIIGYLIYRAVR